MIRCALLLATCLAPQAAMARPITLADVVAALGFSPLTPSQFGQPSGLSQIDAAGTIEAQTVLPQRGTAAPTLAAVLGDTVNLMNFGAKCDGTSDDSAAITAAGATGLRVSIPPGLVCNGASIGLVGVPGLFVGPGRIRTSDGSVRAPIVEQVTSAPVQGQHGSLITNFNGNINLVPFAAEHWIIGAGTLGQPSTGYSTTPETSYEMLYTYLATGWNQSRSSNDGRTGAVAHQWNGYMAAPAQGDLTGWGFSCAVNSTNPAATNALAWPACSPLAGTMLALTDGVGLQGIGDINLTDNGHEAFATGMNINMKRNGPATSGALDYGWMGYRVQSGLSTTPVDSAFSAAGYFNTVFDAASAGDVSPVALTMTSNQRIYGNITQNIVTNGARWPWNQSHGNEWLGFTAGTGWQIAVGGAPALTVRGAGPQVSIHAVATLGPCNASLEGTHTGVTDAVSPTFLGALTGGGTVHSPAYCNGTAWVAG